MKFVIYRCPECKELKLKKKYDTRGDGKNRLYCSTCRKYVGAVRNLALKVFSESEERKARVFYEYLLSKK